jgi:beta-lactamase regulating signal transducer with metallopeptidase domain
MIITVKTSLALGSFYLLYRYLLSKDKLFRRNRFYLLTSSILSFVFPLISIPLIEANSHVLSFAYIANSNTLNNPQSNNDLSAFTWEQILTNLYIIGISVFLLKTIFSYFKVFQIIRQATYKPCDKYKTVTTPRTLPPFSFFRWIVIPSYINHNHPSYEKLVQHELIHCRQYHSVDLFIGELLIALQWFNPFAWLLRKSISENLEYLVDEEMLIAGTNAKDYQYSLLSLTMAGSMPAITNNFNTNLLKKRIVMMNKRKFSNRYLFHNLLIPVSLMLTLGLTASFRMQVKPEHFSGEKKIKTPVKSWNNGQSEPTRSAIISEISSAENKDLFLRYIAQNIKYPRVAIENNISGLVKVLVTFKEGNIQVKEFAKEPGIIELEDVIVVGYGIKDKKQNKEVSSSETDLLRKEVDRVIQNFQDIPKDFNGKTFAVSVKFKLQE